ncbi:MAG: BTAD domain-containing putative transcriptional regulator [Caldilineaceae bacterium]
MIVVQLFGGVQIQTGEQITQIARLRERLLLAFLLLHRDRPHQREKLIELLWPDNESERSGRNFANVLYRLQQVIGKSWLVSEGSSLLLHLPADVTLDVAEFDRLRSLNNAEALQAAITLYSGDHLLTSANLLPDINADWLLPIQTYYHELFLGLLQQLASLHEQELRFEAANGSYQRLRLHDPLNEEAYAGLMRTFARLGRQAEAIASYHELAAILKQELNVQPSPNLSALFDTLQRTPTYVENPATNGKSVSASAQHPTTSPMHNLPKSLTHLIGRKQELEQIGRLLANQRLITITGAGGSGKTRLAIEIGRELADTFLDGACWIDLSALRDESFLTQTVAQGLKLALSTQQDPLQQLSDFLGNKELLLMLDNCEHLVQGCAALVERLLQSCHKLQILATSREALGVAGEVVWLTPTLAVPEVEGARGNLPPATCTPATLLIYPAIQLFVERARAVRATFQLTAENAPAVIEICRRLDGIPLAIELAAARVKMMSVAQIAERLHDRFRLLVNPQRNVLPRQQTLHALIDWSYALLAEPERRLLRQLSIFAGSFRLESAEAICGDGTLEWLTRLVDKSMVLFFERQGEGRYRLLETIHDYARLRLNEASETQTVQLQHAQYFLQLAEQAERNLTGTQQAYWINLLEREHDNLRAALHWSLEAREHEITLRLVRWLGRFWFFRGYYREGGQWVQHALDANAARVESADPASELARLYARTLFHAGRLSRSFGDYAVTNAYFERSLGLLRQQNDPRTTAVVLNSLGVSAMEQNQFTRARTIFVESLTILEQLGNLEELSNPLLNLSQIAYTVGNYHEAKHYAERSLALSDQLQDQRSRAFALEDLASAVMGQGDWSTGQILLEESLTIHRRLSGALQIATVLCHLAELACIAQQYSKGDRLLNEALQLMQQDGIEDMIFTHATNKLLVYLALGQQDVAKAFIACLRSLDVAVQANAQSMISCSLIASAAIAEAKFLLTYAIQLLASATAISQRLGIGFFAFDNYFYQQIRQTLHSRICHDEFDCWWNYGLQLTMEDVVLLARQQVT